MSADPDEYIVHTAKVRHLDEVRIVVFANGSGSALIHGTPINAMLVRVQSACQYGEIWGSLECDCRAQLDESLRLIQAEGSGTVIHLNQEGRGAGLVTKARAYQLSKKEHIDSFEAYQRLDVPLDSRKYDDAADFITGFLNISAVRLLTNNPHKIDGLRSHDLDVIHTPLIKIEGEECAAYFDSKLRQGHLTAGV